MKVIGICEWRFRGVLWNRRRPPGDVISIKRKMKLRASMLALLLATPGFAHAQSTLRMRDTVSPAAATISNAGLAPSAMPMQIAVRLNLHDAAGMEKLKRDQQDRSSPRYHRWLKPEEFDGRFGPTQADADAVARWLTGAGFTVTDVDLARRVIEAQASAAVVSRSLDVKIVSDGTLFANTTEPSVPAALAPLIANIEGLNNTFAVKPTVADQIAFGPPLSGEPKAGSSPDFHPKGGPFGFAPTDIQTYYDEGPINEGGNFGTSAPDCIALPEVSSVHASTLKDFTKEFGGPAIDLTEVLADKKNPGFQGGAELEADLDIEYAHTIAPATPIRLYIGAGKNALQDAIQSAVKSNTCGVISISFSYCGMQPSFFSGTLDPLFSKAASQGQTVFVASGDYGAAGIAGKKKGHAIECVEGHSLNVSEMAADPNVTGVGGTEFEPVYDGEANDISTVLDVPGGEFAWNDGSGATGGGMSTVFGRPSWQSGPRVTPLSAARMVPDVAFGASGNLPGFYLVAFYKGANRLVVVSGTSVGSPSWAGFSRLIAQADDNPRLGLINPRLYTLGNTGSETGLIDVIQGNNSLNGVDGYDALPGYDMTTGWGSPDMSLLLNSYVGP
jgi:subtilase family serine protease